MSTVFRIEKTSDFTVMANHHLRDKRLSYKAKGLLSEMLGLPSDWDYTLTGLAKLSNDGVDSVRAGIKELERYGYVVRGRARDEKGRLASGDYIVYEIPKTDTALESPTEGEPMTGKPTTGNPT